MERIFLNAARRRWLALGAALLLAAVFFGRQLVLLLQLLLGGAALAFVLEPLCAAFSSRVSRPAGAACAFILLALALAGVLLLLAPPVAAQIAALARNLPATLERLQQALDEANAWLEKRNLPTLNVDAAGGDWRSGLGRAMAGTALLAGTVADVGMRLTIIAMLGYYFLANRERTLLRLEWLVPARYRAMAVKMAAGVERELRLYLRGQFGIAAAVGALSAAGFALVGLPSWLVLGLTVAIGNMIPYFGPLLGGIPAALAALGAGWPTVLWTLAVLFAVQQIDGLILSPRVMGGLTGLSAPAVLVALALGGSLAGVAGMLFAIPCLLAGKICWRVGIACREVIEKGDDM